MRAVTRNGLDLKKELDAIPNGEPFVILRASMPGAIEGLEHMRPLIFEFFQKGGEVDGLNGDKGSALSYEVRDAVIAFKDWKNRNRCPGFECSHPEGPDRCTGFCDCKNCGRKKAGCDRSRE